MQQPTWASDIEAPMGRRVQVVLCSDVPMDGDKAGRVTFCEGRE